MGLPGTYPGARVVSPNQIRKMYAVKMDNTGAVQFSAAPTATVSTANAGTVTKDAGGVYKRNYIKGVLSLNLAAGTGSATAWLLTPAGSVQLATGSTSAGGTTSVPFTNGPLDVVPPYSIKIKQANGTLNTVKVKSISINDLTTIYAD